MARLLRRGRRRKSRTSPPSRSPSAAKTAMMRRHYAATLGPGFEDRYEPPPLPRWLRDVRAEDFEAVKRHAPWRAAKEAAVSSSSDASDSGRRVRGRERERLVHAASVPGLRDARRRAAHREKRRGVLGMDDRSRSAVVSWRASADLRHRVVDRRLARAEAADKRWASRAGRHRAGTRPTVPGEGAARPRRTPCASPPPATRSRGLRASPRARAGGAGARPGGRARPRRGEARAQPRVRSSSCTRCATRSAPRRGGASSGARASRQKTSVARAAESARVRRRRRRERAAAAAAAARRRIARVASVAEASEPPGANSARRRWGLVGRVEPAGNTNATRSAVPTSLRRYSYGGRRALARSSAASYRW